MVDMYQLSEREAAIVRTNDENVVVRHCHIKVVRLKNSPGMVWVFN